MKAVGILRQAGYKLIREKLEEESTVVQRWKDHAGTRVVVFICFTVLKWCWKPLLELVFAQ